MTPPTIESATATTTENIVNRLIIVYPPEFRLIRASAHKPDGVRQTIVADQKVGRDSIFGAVPIHRQPKHRQRAFGNFGSHQPPAIDCLRISRTSQRNEAGCDFGWCGRLAARRLRCYRRTGAGHLILSIRGGRGRRSLLPGSVLRPGSRDRVLMLLRRRLRRILVLWT